MSWGNCETGSSSYSSIVKILAFGDETNWQESTKPLSALDQRNLHPPQEKQAWDALNVGSFLPSFIPERPRECPLPARTVQAGRLQKQETQSPGTWKEDRPLCSPRVNADHLLKSPWRSWKVATGFCEMEILKINTRLALSLPGSHQPWSSAGNNEEKQASFAFFFFNCQHETQAGKKFTTKALKNPAFKTQRVCAVIN